MPSGFWGPTIVRVKRIVRVGRRRRDRRRVKVARAPRRRNRR